MKNQFSVVNWNIKNLYYKLFIKIRFDWSLLLRQSDSTSWFHLQTQYFKNKLWFFSTTSLSLNNMYCSLYQFLAREWEFKFYLKNVFSSYHTLFVGCIISILYFGVLYFNSNNKNVHKVMCKWALIHTSTNWCSLRIMCNDKNSIHWTFFRYNIELH